MMLRFVSIGLAVLMFSSACTSKDQIKKALKDDPEILVEAIKANPAKIMMALREASESAQKEMAKLQQEEEEKALKGYYDSPLQPAIRADESFQGPKDAPITLVEYSDFQCPYCARGAETVNKIKQKFGDKVRFVFKHLPLSFHPQAMIAAQYFEALRLQKPEMAFKFHDELFQNQAKIKEGEKYLDQVAKKVGADMAKLKKDVSSEKVKARIQEDMAEAEKFGIQGTPGFVINGIPVKGAYPAEHFEQIVEELKKRGKLTI